MNKTAIQFLNSTIAIFFFSVILSVTGRAQNNYAISFNGSSTANCGNNASFNVTGTAITIEAWIFPTAFSANYWEGSIVAKDGENITGYGLRCGGAGKLNFFIAVAGNNWVEATSADNVLALNKWQHVAAVYNGSQLKLYRDGVQVMTTSENRTLLQDATFPVKIGASPGNWITPRYYTGKIDEVRIWSAAKSQVEIKHNMFRHITTGTGLVASYQMSNGSGTSVTDNTGNGNTATIGAGASWVASPIQRAENALSFDGVDDHVIIPSNSSLDITSAITLEAWVYATKNTGIQNVMCKSSETANTGYIFPRTNDGWANAVLYLHVAGGWRLLTAPYPSLNAWHHLAATYDGASMKIYINGTLASSTPLSGSIATNSNALTFGTQAGYSANPETFGGYADEFRVWNIARTQAQIQADMNKELDPTLQTGLVSYYNINQGITAGSNTGLATLVDQLNNNNGTLTNFSYTGSTSNYVAQSTALTVLPVQWLSFTVQPLGEQALLQWSTSSEQNSKNFTVQRSKDGLIWNNKAVVDAAGNSSITLNYKYTDQLPETGINYYRILQDDLDGRSIYSKVVNISFNKKQPSFTIASNPVNNGNLQLNVNSTIDLSIYNSMGSMVIKKHLQKGATNINLAPFAKGAYWVKAGDDVYTIVSQ